MKVEPVPYGDDALLVAVEDHDTRHWLAEHLRGKSHWINCIVGRQDIVVQYSPLEMSPDNARQILRSDCSVDLVGTTKGKLHMLELFVGAPNSPDLDRIAKRVGISTEETLQNFVRATYTVDMLGFTPGFAYMNGLPADWQIDRLDTPRSHIPAGSVGVISGQCGLYSLSGPGGWPIIGRVKQCLFDPQNEKDPMRLKVGDFVKFRVIAE